MSGRISQNLNQYRVPPVCTSNKTGRVSRNRPRESRDKAKKDQGKIVQLDITSADVRQMDKSSAKAKEKVGDFLHSPAVIVVLYVLAAALAGGLIGE